MRELLTSSGLEVYGDPSAIVCVKMGQESLARLTSRHLPSNGMLANLVEFPAVPKGRARFRLQVMAGHSHRDVADAVHRLTSSVVEAQVEDDAIRAGTLRLEDLVQRRPTVADIAAPIAEAKSAAAGPVYQEDAPRALKSSAA